jgi:hypothetical protein
MTKKHDFLRSEQSRDKHPGSTMVGSKSQVEKQGQRSSAKATASPDRQAPRSGKSSNDHNKMGEKHPTQTNQGRRTPLSRNDRQVIGSGAMNIVEARSGGKGGGRGTR